MTRAGKNNEESDCNGERIKVRALRSVASLRGWEAEPVKRSWMHFYTPNIFL